MITALAKRIISELPVWKQRLVPGQLFGKGSMRATNGYTWEVFHGRQREAMLDGSVYLPRMRGGMLEDVYWLLQRQPERGILPPIIPYFMPCETAVDFYSNAFGGQLGSDIKIADTVNDKPVNPAMLDAILLIWRWSNLNSRASDMTTMAASQGSVGVRIVNNGDRVTLDFDDRRIIRRVEMDSRRNALAVWLRYEEEIYDANGYVIGREQVEEYISKDEFSRKVGGNETIPDDQRENTLGICPYVLINHKNSPRDVFGLHCFHGCELPIHGINYALNQLDESTAAHTWPTWFMTSSAQGQPKPLVFGKNKAIYSQTYGDARPATVAPLVPDLDFAGVQNSGQANMELVRERMPQLAYSNLKLLSGISGETLANVIRVAESESKRARAMYEDGMRRAIQIAVSVAIANGLDGFNLGTGLGTVEAAERAFDGGDGPEAFEFAARPALPQTTYQQVQQAQADQAEDMAKANLASAMINVGLPNEIAWKDAMGYDDAEIAKIKTLRRQQDLLDTEDDNTSN